MTACTLGFTSCSDELMENMNTDPSKVTTIGEKEIDDALASAFDDYEDALQYYSALNKKVDVIVTRNKKDFAHSKLPVLSPDEFLNTKSAN